MVQITENIADSNQYKKWLTAEFSGASLMQAEIHIVYKQRDGQPVSIYRIDDRKAMLEEAVTRINQHIADHDAMIRQFNDQDITDQDQSAFEQAATELQSFTLIRNNAVTELERIDTALLRAAKRAESYVNVPDNDPS